MNDAREAESEHQPYVRAPWPLVAAALLAVLAVALAIGLFANRSLRQQAQLPPTAVPAVAAATQTPEVTAMVPAQTAMTATPLPKVVPTSTGAPSATTSITPSPVIVATARATVSPELTAEVSEAYKEYWQVRAKALYDLDPSHLPAVMAGDHLTAVEDRIGELRSEGRAIETEVDHNYVVVEASVDRAEVADSYVDKSVYVDLQTRVSVSTATGQTLNEIYVMSKTGGAWRVVSLVRSP